MNHRQSGSRRALLIGSGVVLVGVFAAWIFLRNQEAVRSFAGMDSSLGWAAHAAAVLVLLAGVSLLARGVFGRGVDASPQDDRQR